ncbi:unnamed protein product, partial [Polarella glacialis]
AWSLWQRFGRALEVSAQEAEEARQVIESSNSWLRKLQQERGDLEAQLFSALERARLVTEAHQSEAPAWAQLPVSPQQLRDASSRMRASATISAVAETAAAFLREEDMSQLCTPSRGQVKDEHAARSPRGAASSCSGRSSPPCREAVKATLAALGVVPAFPVPVRPGASPTPPRSPAWRATLAAQVQAVASPVRHGGTTTPPRSPAWRARHGETTTPPCSPGLRATH